MKLSQLSSPVSDIQLWEQLKNGSELALGKLIRKYFNLLQNYGFKFIKDEDFIKDCVQEVFIEIWNRRDNISIPESVKAYLLSSVRKKVLRESFRQKIVRDEFATDIENSLNFIEFSPEWTIIEQESLSEMTQKVSELLNQLPKRQREVIYLRFYQNLERDEIAQIMELNPQSVSNHLQAAFKTFRENWTGFVLLLHLISTGKIFF
ncbi:RNA polymerase sigma factor, sigma-70 family [Pseudarcicella hirudinis]|uniref:RNA polymerase sigma factor, sigma-70 family n=1 Tax=Pseudarcicella hirudinis TaxID=1079859 RepID=A0A1I5T3N9_9BACT|nr:sigma-70 family RNA polymerase sigma factor [Pseudarcicella hirudinis]SFP77461.1 RNA polymerase sigma factor, sigma-70 family [Pseudarcicella hirudinis]